jgi:hypothetical protein
VDEDNNLNKLNESDQELLDNIEKIVTHQPHPDTSLCQFGDRLGNIVTPARAAFQRELEARLLAELAAPSEPVVKPVAAPLVKPASIIDFPQNLDVPSRGRKNLTWRRVTSWNNLVLAGMVAVIVVMVGLIGFVVAMNGPIANPTSTPGSVSVQPGSGNTPQTVTKPSSQDYKIELKILSQKADKLSLQATQQVLEQRLQGLGVSNFKVVVESDQLITVIVQGVKDQDQVIKLVSATGLVEIIDPGNQQLAEGEQVSTSYCQKRSKDLAPCSGVGDEKANAQANNKASVANKALSQSSPILPFQTVLTSDQLDAGLIEQDTSQPNSAPIVRIGLKSTASDDILKFAKVNTAKQFTVVLDGQALNTFPLTQSVSDKIEITSKRWNTPQGKVDYINFLLLLKFGPLPLDLEVQSVQPF